MGRISPGKFMLFLQIKKNEMVKILTIESMKFLVFVM